MEHEKLCALACCCCTVEANFQVLRELSKNPIYICKECGRVSTKREFLCHPKKL